MCGIAGYLLLDESAREAVVRAMCAEIRHRGPDDEGVYIEAAAASACGGSASSI